MKRRVRQLVLASGCAVVALLLVVLVEHFRGSWALQARLKELRSGGEKLQVHELLPPRISDEDNAAHAILIWTNELKKLSDKFTDLPPFMKMLSPGRAVPAWRLRRWPLKPRNSAANTPATPTNDWASLGEFLGQARSVVDHVEDALQRPGFDLRFNYQAGFIDFQSPPLVPMKHSAQLLAVAAEDELRRGRVSEAASRLWSLAVLVERQTDERLIISQLVRFACGSIALNGTWDGLQAAGWNEDQLRQLQTVWEGMDFPTDMARSMEMERAMTLVHFQQLQASSANRRRALQENQQTAELLGTSGANQGSGLLPTPVHLALWRIAWAEQDELRALNRWQLIIEADRLARSRPWLEAKAKFDEVEAVFGGSSIFGGTGTDDGLGWYDRCRYLFSREPFSIGGVLILKALRLETQRKMTVTALALQRYRLRTGRPAPDLTVLVPAFLPAVPRDNFDGQALRYRLKADGSFLLYSVGEDGRDDGGDPDAPVKVENGPSMWTGRDAVWPALMSDEQLAAFEAGLAE